MSQQLWLLRHGDAEPHDARPDADRRLTPRGEEQADRAGEALAALGVEIASAWTSPKVRARDTAARACASLGCEPAAARELYQGWSRADADTLMAGADADARVLVVGHEPDFSQVVHDLTGARIDLKKGGVAAVRLGPAPELLVLLRPRELQAIATSR